MKVALVSVLSILILFFQYCDSAKIFAYVPTPSLSHQVVFQALIKDLAARGHEITYLSTDVIEFVKSNPNVTQIDLHDSYQIYKEGFNLVKIKDEKLDNVGILELFLESCYKYLNNQLNKPEVKKLIKNAKKGQFDVVILENFISDSLLAFGEIFDAPIIGMTSLESMTRIHEFNGNEANPVIHPEMMFSFKHGALTFSERFKSLNYYLRLRFKALPKMYTKFLEIINNEFPTVKEDFTELRKRVQLLMINTHPAMGFIRPLLPNTIQLGFMHIEPPRPLADGDLKTFLDDSKNGVIYMSLGSNVQSKDLRPEIKEMFLNVFRKSNMNVLWKFEDDSLLNKPNNVMISKWLPQSDLLAHPNIKLFITQGGQQSMEEAIDRMVPMMVIPFIGEQEANAMRVVDRKVGLKLELHTTTEHILENSIKELLKPEYAQNIKYLREIIYDEPMSSRERAVWWTEYIIRHKGAKHLEYEGRNVPFYQRYWLDFMGIVLMIFFTFMYVTYKFYKFINLKKTKTE
jgi:glucuronosyltransferase